MSLSAEQEQEIDAQRARVDADAPRDGAGARGDPVPPLPVLDHGFVRVVDYMGDDDAIVQAARVSYGAVPSRSRDDAG